MADHYVDSNAAGLNDGTSWTDAWTSLASADGTVAAGDTVYIADNHNESSVGAINFTNATHASPVILISAETTGTTYSKGAIVAGITSSWTGPAIIHGVILRAGGNVTWNGPTYGYNCEVDGANFADIWFQDTNYFENTVFGRNGLSGTTPPVGCRAGMLYLVNCSYEASAASKGFAYADDQTGHVVIRNSDASNLAATAYLFRANQTAGGHMWGSGNLLPSGGLITDSALTQVQFVEAYSCHNANSFFQYEVTQLTGTALVDTANYRTTNSQALYDQSSNRFSIEVTPTSSGSYGRPFRMCLTPNGIWCDANPTLTVHGVYDANGVTAYNTATAWIEVEHPDTTNLAHRKLDVTARAADITTAGGSLTASTETWTISPAMTTETKVKFAETVASGGAGMHFVWLCIADNGSQTPFYCCPDVDVS